VVLIALFNVIAVVLLTGISLAFAHFSPRLSHLSAIQLAQEPLVLLPPQALAYVAMLFFMTLVVRRYTDQPFWTVVKWRWPSNPVMLIGIGLLLSLIIQLSSTLLPIPKSLPIDQFFRTTRSAWLLTIFGVAIAPLFEELFFRGFLYPALYKRLGFVAALIINSLFFAIIHSGQLAHAWAPLLVLTIVGMTLTLVRAQTQSVACSFLVHSAYNLFLFASIFTVTGGFRHMDKLSS
jgi:membrane protease YdiL (CAAX protease family)